MRRFSKWIAALGLVTLAPGLSLAGVFDFGKKDQPAEKAPASAAKSSAVKGTKNQDTANDVAQALKGANLAGRGNDIEIKVQNGICVLTGSVSSPAQRSAATRAASAVAGVKRVDNLLTVARPAGAMPEQAVASNRPARRSPIQQTNFQEEGFDMTEPPGLPPEGAPEAPVAPPAPGGMRPVAPPPYAPTPMGPPGYGPAGPGMGPHVAYDQPGMPNYAWPSYAQYPNYAAVTYPKQYSASAWPYIGPFYPYPQVPLGWRKAQLEWDDGYWQLNFRPRTDRWWWFLNYQNW